MRFSDGVLDIVAIFLTLALCVSCTGTWVNWRREFKWWGPLLYNAQPIVFIFFFFCVPE